jgi:hypothetical protein
VRKRVLLLAIFLSFLSFAYMAKADCTYNGKRYPEGTIIGPYICKGDHWTRR